MAELGRKIQILGVYWLNWGEKTHFRGLLAELGEKRTHFKGLLAELGEKRTHFNGKLVWIKRKIKHDRACLLYFFPQMIFKIKYPKRGL